MMEVNKRLKKAGFIAVSVAALCVASPLMAQDDYIGDIKLVGYTYCPRSTTEAAGQLLAISSNTALYSLYGCTYGGDCRTTFALPDLRSRVPVGQGQGPGLPNVALGQKGGATTTTLSVAQIPVHSHSATTNVTVTSTLQGSATAADSSDPTGRALAGSNRPTYLQTTPTAPMASGSVSSQATATTTVGNAGGSQSFNIQNPYVGLRYCVVLQGIFPPRD